MATLKFQGPSLKALAERALATNHEMFHLVKDEGIYIMIFGTSKEEGHKICYANGYDPKVVTDSLTLFDRCRAAVGGDDFKEDIKFSRDDFTTLAMEGAILEMQVTAKSIRMFVTKPAPQLTEAEREKQYREHFAKSGIKILRYSSPRMMIVMNDRVRGFERRGKKWFAVGIESMAKQSVLPTAVAVGDEVTWSHNGTNFKGFVNTDEGVNALIYDDLAKKYYRTAKAKLATAVRYT